MQTLMMAYSSSYLLTQTNSRAPPTKKRSKKRNVQSFLQVSPSANVCLRQASGLPTVCLLPTPVGLSLGWPDSSCSCGFLLSEHPQRSLSCILLCSCDQLKHKKHFWVCPLLTQQVHNTSFRSLTPAHLTSCTSATGHAYTNTYATPASYGSRMLRQPTQTTSVERALLQHPHGQCWCTHALCQGIAPMYDNNCVAGDIPVARTFDCMYTPCVKCMSTKTDCSCGSAASHRAAVYAPKWRPASLYPRAVQFTGSTLHTYTLRCRWQAGMS